MLEKFSLKCVDYHSNWSRSLSKLRTETDFADVTLVSDDKVKFSAHKLLLSSCSNIFNFILKENTHANPLIFLSGINSVNLSFILDYVYDGEVNLYHKQLDSFLESSRKLEIEGLLGGMEEEDTQEKMHSEKNIELKDEPNEENILVTMNSIVNINHLDGKEEMERPERLQLEENIRMKDESEYQPNEDMKLFTNNSIFPVRKDNRRQASSIEDDVERIDVTSMTPEEREINIEKLYQKCNGVWACISCGFTSVKRSNMKRHVQIHIDGLSYTCELCTREFRLKGSLNNHIRLVHSSSEKKIRIHPESKQSCTAVS